MPRSGKEKTTIRLRAKSSKREQSGSAGATDIEYAPESGQKVDKEFLNFAFSLLSHAKDINGSLNVLIEQIGKKYGSGLCHGV